MSSRFVINVTHNDQRLFSTNRAASLDAGNITTHLTRMQAGFPESEGYKVEAFEITRGDAVVTKIDPATHDDGSHSADDAE